MPLYEYECSQCHRRTEKIQKFSDVEITICPHCAGPLERTLTAPNVQFKGGGWYKDLYSSAKPPAANGAGGESSAGGESGAGGESSAAAASPKPGSGSSPASSPGSGGGSSSAASSASAPAAPAAAPGASKS